MNLVLKKLLIVMSLVVFSRGLYAEQHVSQEMNEMSQEEQQQLMEMMLMRKMIVEVMKDLIATNKMTVDWLLENYTKDQEKSMEKVMHVVQVHLKNRGSILLNSLSKEFGITNDQEKKDFIANALSWLSQVVPLEFDKWIYFSAQAGLVRRK